MPNLAILPIFGKSESALEMTLHLELSISSATLKRKSVQISIGKHEGQWSACEDYPEYMKLMCMVAGLRQQNNMSKMISY